MKHSPAKILVAFFAKAGICSLPSENLAWPAYPNELPDTVAANNAVLFSDTAGMQDGRNMRSGQTIEHPGIQVMVRSLEQSAAWTQASIIATVMDAIYRQTIVLDTASYLLQSVSRKGSIIPLGRERQQSEVAKNRFLFTINATTSFEPSNAQVLLPKSRNDVSLAPFWSSVVPSGTINGSNAIFTLLSAIPSTKVGVFLFVDGVLKKAGASNDYVLSATTITFNSGKQPSTGSSLLLVWADQG